MGCDSLAGLSCVSRSAAQRAVPCSRATVTLCGRVCESICARHWRCRPTRATQCAVSGAQAGHRIARSMSGQSTARSVRSIATRAMKHGTCTASAQPTDSCSWIRLASPVPCCKLARESMRPSAPLRVGSTRLLGVAGLSFSNSQPSRRRRPLLLTSPSPLLSLFS